MVPEIKNAVITWNGDLTPKFKYIRNLRLAQDKLKSIAGY